MILKYDFSIGWQNPWRKRKLLNAAQYTTLMKEAASYQGETNIDNILKGMGNSDTDWQDVLYNDNAPVQNHQLSISGATEKLNYYLSMAPSFLPGCDSVRSPWQVWQVVHLFHR